jgi:hypothetical protein
MVMAASAPIIMLRKREKPVLANGLFVVEFFGFA